MWLYSTLIFHCFLGNFLTKPHKLRPSSGTPDQSLGRFPIRPTIRVCFYYNPLIGKPNEKINPKTTLHVVTTVDRRLHSGSIVYFVSWRRTAWKIKIEMCICRFDRVLHVCVSYVASQTLKDAKQYAAWCTTCVPEWSRSKFCNNHTTTTNNNDDDDNASRKNTRHRSEYMSAQKAQYGRDIICLHAKIQTTGIEQ